MSREIRRNGRWEGPHAGFLASFLGTVVYQNMYKIRIDSHVALNIFRIKFIEAHGRDFCVGADLIRFK
jgi:hypothetical protein